MRLIIVPESAPDGIARASKRRIYLLLFIAVLQPLFMYFLTSHLRPVVSEPLNGPKNYSENIPSFVQSVTEVSFEPVSIKRRMRTVDGRLLTGYKTLTWYKMRTRNYGLGIIRGLSRKCRRQTVYIKTALES